MRTSVVFWTIVVGLVIADYVTKRLAVAHLTPFVPHEVFGNAVRFTLTFNPGAALPLSAGSNSRRIFAVITISLMTLRKFAAKHGYQFTKGPSRRL